LGEFYSEFDTGYAILATQASGANSARDEPMYSEEDENQKGFDHRNFGSSTRKLLLNGQKEENIPGERLHKTTCPDIYFLELIVPHKRVLPVFPKKLVPS
jgi:hypothetical protein